LEYETHPEWVLDSWDLLRGADDPPTYQSSSLVDPLKYKSIPYDSHIVIPRPMNRTFMREMDGVEEVEHPDTNSSLAAIAVAAICT
jgi:hypothetical protein